ncbi:MAG: hypothetical protein ABS69_18760 [Nitrosomonadales bacterium SCN 54-20]|nr:MAG: hypothetical protein ABS69_18760 [Nitrosomonadales bacterium SCN 54-20]
MNHGVTREYGQWISSREAAPGARLFVFLILSHQTGFRLEKTCDVVAGGAQEWMLWRNVPA